MGPAPISSDRALALARTTLGRAVEAVERLPVGFGNDSWRVSTDDGTFTLKVGPPSAAPKWASARQAHDLAAAVGVPVPELVHFAVHPDAVVRVLRWVDGEPLASVLDDPTRTARFAGDLGRAVAALHGVERTDFSSRLDGSAPSFPRWGDYIGHRLGQVRHRALAAEALDARVLDRIDEVAGALAEEVSPVVRPTLCHRDLHPDNVLVGPDGRLVAILDWDMAESWDAAGDWFKLDWLLLPRLGAHGAEVAAAYRTVHTVRPRWAERTRLVEVIESANAVANARTAGWAAFGEEAYRRLLAALDGPPPRP